MRFPLTFFIKFSFQNPKLVIILLSEIIKTLIYKIIVYNTYQIIINYGDFQKNILHFLFIFS